MEIKFLLLILCASLLFCYYLYVLYKTLRYKRKYGKNEDARDLYLRTGPFHLLLFGKLFKNDEKSDYKILKEDEEENLKS
ncbi:MAG: hypothetical protein EOO47_05345 [Flavobacterium sp.]|nr:MAG: hypothetical protein EOO47_05345 [Flavobacterium sp.]